MRDVVFLSPFGKGGLRGILQKNMVLIKIDQLAKLNFDASPVKRQLQAEEVCRAAKEAVEKVFNNKIISAMVEIVSFCDGMLKIKCANSVVACELQQKAHLLTEHINNICGENVVGRVVFMN